MKCGATIREGDHLCGLESHDFATDHHDFYTGLLWYTEFELWQRERETEEMERRWHAVAEASVNPEVPENDCA